MSSVSKLELLTRIGFAARGVLYLSIGYLALRYGRTESQSGALEYWAGSSGPVLLAVMAAGLLGYGIWRLSEAVVDTEGKGTRPTAIAARIGGAVSGIVHLLLAFAALDFAFGLGGGGGGGSGNEASSGAAAALAIPGGSALVILAGAALIGTGVWQLINAAKADFLRHLDARAAHRGWVKWFGRVGYAARGVIFLTIGWSLLNAGLSGQAEQADGLAQAIDGLPAALFTAVAFGLVLFGLFSFVEARHRKIADPKVLERLKGALG